ncbi:hypothetical protein DFJ73DRAFT_878011 [Zopfochytrium polystomum]|nr:hypothetical protein DFJ73DRAFT_878011 [Zopfochytrium polystomum]
MLNELKLQFSDLNVGGERNATLIFPDRDPPRSGEHIILYRAINFFDFARLYYRIGLTPRSPYGQCSPEAHIRNADETDSPYISMSTDAKWTIYHSLKQSQFENESRDIIAVRVPIVTAERVDLKDRTASSYAKSASEVLVKGSLPLDRFKRICPFKGLTTTESSVLNASRDDSYKAWELKVSGDRALAGIVEKITAMLTILPGEELENSPTLGDATYLLTRCTSENPDCFQEGENERGNYGKDDFTEEEDSESYYGDDDDRQWDDEYEGNEWYYG